MVISRLNKYYLSLFILLALLPGCITTSKCPDNAVGQFTLKEWQGAMPKTVSLMRYQKGSNFKTLLETYPPEHLFVSGWRDVPEIKNLPKAVQVSIGSGPVNKDGWPEKFKWQSISSDYKLILDNKVEYRITDIESTHEGKWGCPLKSFKVNNHIHDVGHNFNFKQSIGEPVKQ